MSRLIIAAAGAAVLVVVAVAVAPTEKTKISFAQDAKWEDGLCEMSYYDARDVIYGQERRYTRVHLLNRQFMNRVIGVKEPAQREGAVTVFKFNVAEEIPTDNYNYRYLTTTFVELPGLKPFKQVSSSQEWCGASYAHLRWLPATHEEPAKLDVQGFGYFPDEGEMSWTTGADAVPYEALFLLAREAASTGETRELLLLPPTRSIRLVTPDIHGGTLKVAESARTVKSGVGRREAVRVTLEWDGVETWYDVETSAPYRVLAYKNGDQTGTLKGVERRAYWDQDSRSKHYSRNRAP